MVNGTKGDMYTKRIIRKILKEGCLDKDPRPVYASDGAPAHTYSINHGMCTYDLTKGETPLITLRPIAVKNSVGELLWIYQDESSNLDLLAEKYGVAWWDQWDLGNRDIGSVYGSTIKDTNQMYNLLEGLIKEPDSRRHIIDLWQIESFKKPHGLKPCAYNVVFNVRHGKNGVDYLDMSLKQRSSDFMVAGCINQVQYLVFLYLVARHCGYTPGRFTWFYDNIQIYDRHVKQAKEMLKREPIECNPEIWLNPDKTNFYDFTQDDVKITGYPLKLVREKNPQMTFDLGV